MGLVAASKKLSSVTFITNRYYVKTAVVVGGTTGGIWSGDPVEVVHSMDTTTREWSKLSISPRHFTYPFGVSMVAVESQLYVVGFTDTTDRHYTSSQDPYINRFLSKFDPNHNTWEYLPPMESVRVGSVLLASSAELFLIGGVDPSSYSLRTCSTLETYCIHRNLWTEGVTTSSRSFVHAAGAKLGRVFYVLGGIDNFEETASMETLAYTVSPIRRWATSTPMLNCRSAFGVVALKFCIIACGGCNIKNPNGIASTESFDTRTGVWTLLESMLLPRIGFAIAVCNEKVYIFGGSTGDENTDNAYSTVEYFTPTTGSWTFDTPMPLPRTGACARFVGLKR